MSNFYLEILTPERVFYKGECRSLIVPITDGMLGVQAHRAPVTASITSGEAYYTRPDGEQILFSVSRGNRRSQRAKRSGYCPFRTGQKAK